MDPIQSTLADALEQFAIQIREGRLRHPEITSTPDGQPVCGEEHVQQLFEQARRIRMEI